MSRSHGHMNAGRIDRSARHQRILHVLKEADHPLSGEEISARIQTMINRIPQAVSTTIGEMRSDENRQLGYIVSFSAKWKEAKHGEQFGRRVNRDESITYFIERITEPWQDGRPRYWLIAAPEWRPRWRIDDMGQVLWRGGDGPIDIDKLRRGDAGSENRRGADVSGERLCVYGPCNNPVPPERLAEGLWSCCDEHGRLWRAEMKMQFAREDLKLF